MLAASVLVTLVAMATAQTPQPCCLPDKYELQMVDTKEYGSGLADVTTMMTDATTKKVVRMVYTQTAGQPGVLKYHQIQDFNAKKIYTIMPNDMCYTTAYDVPFYGTCIPKDAVYLGSSYVGKASTPNTDYDSWMFTLDKANVTVAVDKHCILIGEGIHGQLGGYPVDSAYIFFNFKDGISDPSLFVLPKSCTP